MTKQKKIILILLPLLVALGFGSFLYYQHTAEVAKYSFTVQSDTKEIKLSDFRGKKTIVYFGYGLCPDICPTTLTAIAGALNKLTPVELNSIEVVFISVDPDRDKPKELSVFARYFHPKIIGATANEAHIKTVATNYGASYKKVPQPDSAIGYSVAHSADAYLIGKNGKLEKALPFGASSDEIAADIRR